MTTTITAFILGLLQGLTEFLPISSTGHLLIAKRYIDETAIPLSGIIGAANLGSTIALLYFFGNPFLAAFQSVFASKPFSKIKTVLYKAHRTTNTSILETTRTFIPPTENSSYHSRRFLASIGCATIPALFLGALFHKSIQSFFYTPYIIGWTLLLGGCIFLLLPHRPQKAEPLSKLKIGPCEMPTLKTASLIGLAQAFALIPGVSRSGATIASGIALGMSTKSAMEFSFLLAVPILLGASCAESYKNLQFFTLEQLPLLIISFCSACLGSFLVIKPSIALLQKRGLAPFGWYRIFLGLLILL